jgi:hypothetical protein
MRTITLELLRHGQAHNQLLSPLTPYLALCENHGAETIHVPFEHNQFLHRLSALGYKLDNESRIFQLNDTARVLGNILGAIPGLTAESSRADNTGDNLTHLRLIISASELALLPFELAISPNGLPGSGQHLLLQPQMPICLTREIRRVPGEQLQWPLKPKILFIAASPPDVGNIPVESHLLTLRRVIEPWVKYFHPDDKEKMREQLDKHLVFLPGASIEDIEKHCATNSFTHIHILAHGVERQENYDTRFFIALHNKYDASKTEYISGARLATALRPSQRPNSGELAKPVVVTLASCDSGNVGSVAGAGASIAHALHESGIPMVVAGQFPLSFEGSVCLVDCLYDGLLWGNDPRRLLYDLRRRLYAQFQDKHDWASLTAYVSLPPDFEQQLSDVQIDQALQNINASMNHADEAIQQSIDNKVSARYASTSERKVVNNEDVKKLLKTAKEKIDKAKNRLESLLDRIPAKKMRIYGLLASTEKRQAEIMFSLYLKNKTAQDWRTSIELLRKSQEYYWQTFRLDSSESWSLVQYLSLGTLFNELLPDPQVTKEQAKQADSSTEVKEDKKSKEDKKNRSVINKPPYELERLSVKTAELWSTAKTLSESELHNPDRPRSIWAHSNLMELYLLFPYTAPDRNNQDALADAHEQALKYADTFIDLAGRNSFAVYSTRRQIERYKVWFAKIASLDKLLDLADEIHAKFPEDAEVAEL